MLRIFEFSYCEFLSREPQNTGDLIFRTHKRTKGFLCMLPHKKNVDASSVMLATPVVRDCRLFIVLCLLRDVTASTLIVSQSSLAASHQDLLNELMSCWKRSQECAQLLDVRDSQSNEEHSDCCLDPHATRLRELTWQVDALRRKLITLLMAEYFVVHITFCGPDSRTEALHEILEIDPWHHTRSVVDGQPERQASLRHRLWRCAFDMAGCYSPESTMHTAATPSTGFDECKLSRPLRDWMVEASDGRMSTAAALRLLTHAHVTIASDITTPIDGGEKSKAGSAPSTCARGASSPWVDDDSMTLTGTFSIVVAARPVAPCPHTELCFGNQQFLLVECDGRHCKAETAEEDDLDDSNNDVVVDSLPESSGGALNVAAMSFITGVDVDPHGNDCEEPTVHTLFAKVCSTVVAVQRRNERFRRRRDESYWGSGVSSDSESDSSGEYEGIGVGLLLESSSFGVWRGSDGAPARESQRGSGSCAPSVTPRRSQGVVASTTRLDMTSPAHHEGGASIVPGWLQLESRKLARSNVDFEGASVFVREVTSRLQFWVSRGFPRRDYEHAFEEHGATIAFEEDNDISTSAAVGVTCFETIISIPIKCFSVDVATAEVRLSVPITTTGSTVQGKDKTLPIADQDAMSRLLAARRNLAGSTFSITSSDVVEKRSSSTPPCECDAQRQSIVSMEFRKVSFTDIRADVAAHCSSSINVVAELRKLQHMLFTLSATLRGVVYHEQTAKLKASFVLERREDTVSANDGSAVDVPWAFTLTLASRIDHVLDEVCTSRVVLVDLDRTIVDNAVLEHARTSKRHRYLDAANALKSTSVSWIVRTPSAHHDDDGEREQGQNEPSERLEPFHPQSVLPPHSRVKSENIWLRPKCMSLLRMFAQQWGIPMILATKSSRPRALAILSHLVDKEGEVFASLSIRKEPHAFDGGEEATSFSYRIFAADDIVTSEARRSGRIVPLQGTKAFNELLLRGSKHTADILDAFPFSAPALHFDETKRARCGFIRNGATNDRLVESNAVATSSVRYAIIDDSPHCWAEGEWHRTVAVDPFTLSHVDRPTYWDLDGAVAVAVTRRLMLPKTCVSSSALRRAEASPEIADTVHLSYDIPPELHCAAPIVEDEEDPMDGYAYGSASSYGISSKWATDDVEDVIPV